MKKKLLVITFCICFSSFHASAQVNPSATRLKPEPSDWFTGDIHVHRNCGEGSIILPLDTLSSMMEPNDLDVVSLLADMGNGEVKYSEEDLPRVNGKDAVQSKAGRIIRWDAEWHWDATYSQFGHQALGGHLVLLGLKNTHQIWAESPHEILQWAKKQNAVTGFAHMEYLNGNIQDTVNCCIPIDYPVEAALGTIDFVSEDVYGIHTRNDGQYYSEGTINAYYKLLNCGFKLGLAAGTDYPCNYNEPWGSLLTYVKIPGKKITYGKWINGIAEGRTVVSRNGHNEFLEMKVNDKAEPGANIQVKENAKVTITAKWTATKETPGLIELVRDGKVIATQSGTAKPGEPIILSATADFIESGWMCARRMDLSGHHVLHTAPVYVTVNNKPVRASADDAQYFVAWIDNLLKRIEPGGPWNKYFPNDLETVQQNYRKARNIYSRIAAESKK